MHKYVWLVIGYGNSSCNLISSFDPHWYMCPADNESVDEGIEEYLFYDYGTSIYCTCFQFIHFLFMNMQKKHQRIICEYRRKRETVTIFIVDPSINKHK